MRIQRYLYRKLAINNETPSRPKYVSNVLATLRRPVTERPIQRVADDPSNKGRST